MGTVENRLAALERIAIASVPPEPALIAYWPRDPALRPAVEAQVLAAKAAGRRIILFTTASGEIGAPPPEPLPAAVRLAIED